MLRTSKILYFIFLCLALTQCAYNMGSGQRSLPGGYRLISIPIFKNQSQEPQIEMFFTNRLRENFLRSKIGKVTESNYAEVELRGNIESIQYISGTKKVAGDSSAPFLPQGSAIATEYRILAKISVKVIRKADQSVLWEGDFSGERTYVAPQVTVAGVNSVNPLYNLSARRQNIELIARDVMLEAHDRLTENF